MTQNEYIRLFFAFLKDNDAYNKFMRNFKKYRVTLYSMNDILLTKPATGFIFFAFCWKETKEGSKYWRNIYDKWNKICTIVDHP